MFKDVEPQKWEQIPRKPESTFPGTNANRLISFFNRLNPANWFNEFRDIKITMEEPSSVDRSARD